MAIETRNVLGSVLQSCSIDPLTGWHRDGCCRSGAGDAGLEATHEAALEFIDLADLQRHGC